MTRDRHPDYTGEVSPGGEPDRRTAGNLEITKLAVDEQMSNNCYLLRCLDTGDQVLIDAADEPERLLELIGDGGLTAVVTTHQHWDHHRALPAVVQATGADVVAGEPDADAITEQTGVPVDQSRRRGRHDRRSAPARCGDPGRRAHPRLDLPGVRRRVRAPHLFTGDSPLPRRRRQHPERRRPLPQLIDDVSTRIFDTLPDETWFYPGHGNDSTLGVERPHLDEWRERGW